VQTSAEMEHRLLTDSRDRVDDEDYLLTSLAASDGKQWQLAPTQPLNVNFDEKMLGKDVADCLITT